MKLGTFSVSLTVKDIWASRDFYATLGFELIGGDGEGWAIMQNGDTVIGLFHAMFDQNILTFNPGWDGPMQESAEFTDIRRIRDELAASGIGFISDTTQESASGPASLMLIDPDGNQILIDQHV